MRSSVLRTEDECRLSEKYASTLFYGHEPEKARQWFERALEGYHRAEITAKNAELAGTLLLRLSRQYWLDASTAAALPLISEAIQFATAGESASFFARASLAMAHYLILLGRYPAAEPFFKRSEEISESEPPETRAVSLDQRAILYAARGSRAEAYRNFDAAVEAAKRIPDGYQVTSVWDDYGIWAMALGDINTAQLCKERALFVARERHIAWRVAYLSLRYADLLLELEQYEHARDLVLDSLTYDCKTPCIKILVTSIGTRLAVALDDEGLLRRCADEHAIEYAFRSGEPARIGPIVSAMVRKHIKYDEMETAAKLVRRALPLLLSADHACDLLVDAATLGTASQQRAARDLLRVRAALPNGKVARAYLALFDAALANRQGRYREQRASARSAAEQFKRIGWPAHERTAMTYTNERWQRASAVAPSARSFRTMLGDLSTLTRREAQVADLALKGLTNRSIARELSISEYTVESHMTSIMNRLGIRSRHQLSNMVMDSGRPPEP